MVDNTTYKKILKAAQKLIVQKSYNEVSLNMIAQKAGITKPSLYYYFRNKEELFKQIFENINQEFDQKLEEVLRQKKPATVKLHLFIEVYVEFFFSKKNLIRILFQQFSRKDKKICRKMKETKKEILDRLEKVVSEVLQEQGKGNKIESRLASMMILGMLGPFFAEYAKSNDFHFSPCEVADKVFALLEIEHLKFKGEQDTALFSQNNQL
jgi:AcrR family transcriptional regulator